MPRKPREPKRADLEIAGVFDIECQDWTIFVCGGLRLAGPGSGADYQAFTWQSEDELVDAILAQTGILWAHHGGKYDALWLTEHLRRRGLRAKIDGGSASRISCLDLRPALNLRIRDSACLFPGNLDSLARLGGQHKAELGLPCRCRRRACRGQGYCSIRRDMPPAELRRLLEYLRADCEALYAGLEGLRALCGALDLDLAGTIGSAAWKTARRWLGLPKAEWTWREYRFAERARFGGRAQVFRRASAAGWRYDVHAAYPAALSRAILPWGTPTLSEDPSSAQRAYQRGQEGVYQAIADVPPSFAPPLPIRIRNRVGYPTGRLRGTWTGLELRAAEAAGARVEVRRSLTFDHAERLLAYFAERLVGYRDRFARETPENKWLKEFVCALTGKVGQNPEMEEIALRDDPPQACPADGACYGILCGIGMCCKHKCSGRCGRWDPLDPRGTLWSRTVYRINTCSHVHWAAILCAGQRIELRAEIEADYAAGGTASYVDNDELFTERPRARNVGEGMGEWRPVGPAGGTYSNLRALAPKTLRWQDADGTVHARAKGFPDAPQVFDLLEAGVPVPDFRGVEGLKRAAKGGLSLFTRKQRLLTHRKREKWVGDRQLGQDGVTTFPADVRELREEWSPVQPLPVPGRIVEFPVAED